MPIYKDNDSDIIIALCGSNKEKVFNKLVGFNRKNIKYKNKYYRYGKYNYNDENYILVELDEDMYIEFIAFNNPLITLIVSNNINKDLDYLINTIEISNNIIFHIDDNIEINKKINSENIIFKAFNLDNNIEKLKGIIYNKSYENKNILIEYDLDIENSINLIKRYLDKNIDYKYNRWLSIVILRNMYYDLILTYLNYDYKNDIDLINIINKINTDNINNRIINKINLLKTMYLNNIYEKTKI